jgi:subtilisin family serine protease
VLPFQALNDLGATYNCHEKPCVINASWIDTRRGVGSEFIDLVKSLSMEYLFVAAAGDRSGTAGPGGAVRGGPLGDACDLVPACLGELPNVITVTSFLRDAPNTLDPLANYNAPGRAIVTLAAPGERVFGTIRESKFTTLSGTSQATAFVTGAAALLEAANHRLTPAQIKNRLLYTADLDYSYDGKVAFGKLNVKRALAYNGEDIVYTGGNEPKRGVFDYVQPGSGNANRMLLLYRKGRENDIVGDVKVPRVRRITKNQGTTLYTVVYENQEGTELRIVRDVTFEPGGRPGHIGDRMFTSFRLLSCTRPRAEGTSARDWIGACPRAEIRADAIRLDQISDLIVRAEAGGQRR